MKFEDILSRLEKAPTLMGVDREMDFIGNLVKFNACQMEGKSGVLVKILDILDESHANDGYLEVTEDNKDGFLLFADWIESLATQSDEFDSIQDDLVAYAETFRLLPWEIY